MISSHSASRSRIEFITALIGCRVRYRRHGEPMQGVIVQISSAGRETLVALDDGSFVRVDVQKLERVDEIAKLLEQSPYRSQP